MGLARRLFCFDVNGKASVQYEEEAFNGLGINSRLVQDRYHRSDARRRQRARDRHGRSNVAVPPATPWNCLGQYRSSLHSGNHHIYRGAVSTVAASAAWRWYFVALDCRQTLASK